MKIHLRTQVEVSSIGRGIIKWYSHTGRGKVGECLEWGVRAQERKQGIHVEEAEVTDGRLITRGRTDHLVNLLRTTETSFSV